MMIFSKNLIYFYLPRSPPALQFYHACDGDRRYLYCMMPYRVLSHCDFFGSIFSVYITMIAMARLAETRRTFVLVLGALGVVIGVVWNKHSLAAFMVPAVLAFTIMMASWVSKIEYVAPYCYNLPDIGILVTEIWLGIKQPMS